MSSDEKLPPDGSKPFLGDVDRRSFLRVLGAAFSTVVLPEMVTSCASNEDGASVSDSDALTVTGAVNVVRPQDLLVLRISFVNMKHNVAAGTLVRLSRTNPAQIILDFPPQAILEDAVTIQTGNSTTPFTIPGTYANGTPLANSMLGGPSRLIFQVPGDYTPRAYTLSSILDICAQSNLVLSPTMQTSLTAVVTPPASDPTSGDPLVDRMLAAALASSDPAASSRSAAFNQQLPAGLTSFAGTNVGMTGSPQPAGISDNSVTQIEMPFRVKLSPNCQSGFSHATTPVQGVTKAYEVWHTSLGVRSVGPGVSAPADERNSYLRTVRALWTRDWDQALNGSAGQQLGSTPLAIQNPSLQVAQREAIVVNSSGTGTSNPVQVHRLMLSSLGGYLDARGDWPGGPNNVSRWIHKMSGGRETFVEVDTPGYLLPFGNSATSVQITQRNDNPNVGPVGELYSYNIIIIGNPVTSYRTAGLSPYTQQALLQWPFAAIELKKTHFIVQRINGVTAWPVDASGTAVMVPAVGYDRRGRAIHFSVPLFFANKSVLAGDALNAYHQAIVQPTPYAAPRTSGSAAVGSTPTDPGNPNTGHPSLNIPMGGQRIAYADSKTTSATASPTTAPPKDDTSFATDSLSFDVINPGSANDSFQQPATSTPQFVPLISTASIYLEALHQYLPAQSDGSTPPVNVWYHDRFLGGPGFDLDKNKSQLLFKLANPVAADFTKDPSGAQRGDGGSGFVAPNMTFNAISRKTGAAYDGTLTTPSNGRIRAQGSTDDDGHFDPAKYLGTALGGVKILGVFSILDIVQMVDPGHAQDDLNGLVSSAEEAALKYAPKFIAEGLSELEKIISLIGEVKSQVELLYTNAAELVGNNGIPGTLTNASNVLANGLAADIQPVVAAVKQIISDAQKLYGNSATAGTPATGLQETIALIESLNVLALGDPNGASGSIIELLTNAQTLLKDIKALRDLRVRANLSAVSNAVNSSNASRAPIPVGQVANAALQIASGVEQSVLTKLTQLMKALGVTDGALGVLDGVLPDAKKIASDFTNFFKAAEQALDAVRDMTVKIEWQPKVGSFGPDGWTIFRPATQHALTLTMEVRAKATEKQSAGVDVNCRIDHFDICIGQTSDGNGGSTGIISLQFDHIALQMLAGHKPDVDVKINGITFGGPLSFLETLKKIIPMDGFSDPPYLDIDSNGIKAGFSLQIPNVAIGMFSIENIAISAEVDIPLVTSGDASATLTFTFSFCDKDHPFIVTVSLLGGGGYFTVSLSPKGLQHLEASICVGAQLAINLLDIAQGSVSIMAGITFTIDKSTGKEDVKLTAFLRLHGELDILGIISISVDLSVSMTYDFTNKIIIAEAEVKVDVSILFFSIHVKLPFRKEFHSCNNDPTLRQLMPPPQFTNIASTYWSDYVNAYAV